jgi:hypothetical protein
MINSITVMQLVLDFKDVCELGSLNPFETNSPTEELVRAGLPTCNVNQEASNT